MSWFPLGVIVGLIFGVPLGLHLRVRTIDESEPVTSPQRKSSKPSRAVKRAVK
ncbi:MAG: hypothetical protein KJZ75_11075 [Hyphomonadaceae bacterium]|nr:hypothetical protein [Hyphomonadaceae bacterium]